MCNPTSVDYVDGIAAMGAAFDDSFDIGEFAVYGQQCKDDPLLGKPVYNAVGTIDPHFPAGYVKDRWVTYSIEVLGCNPHSQQVDTSRSNAVSTCRYFSDCPGGK